MAEHDKGDCPLSSNGCEPSLAGCSGREDSDSMLSKKYVARFAAQSSAELAKISLDFGKSLQGISVKLPKDAFSSAAKTSMQLAHNWSKLDLKAEQLNSISSIGGSFKSMANNFWPEVFGAAKAISEAWLTQSAGYKNAFARSAKKLHVLEVMSKTNWPLYLVEDDKMISRLEKLNAESPTLQEDVREIAERCLDVQWLDSVFECWSQHEELGQGRLTMMERALSHHKAGRYDACVSILMCLFEGITAIHLGSGFSFSEETEKNLFNHRVEKHNLNPLSKRKSEKLCAPKDLVVAMTLVADTGWYTWQRAADYIVGVVLTNQYEESIAAHNPLRNKICHGEQTNYGTKEHSLKAILSTDLVIRLGYSAQQGLRMRSEGFVEV